MNALPVAGRGWVARSWKVVVPCTITWVAAAAGAALSARNRFPGIVRSIEVDGVMALVEIQAGPHAIVAAITRDAVEELELREGMPATATVKATSVMIDASLSESSARGAT